MVKKPEENSALIMDEDASDEELDENNKTKREKATFDEIVEQIAWRYSTSFRTACQMLKCERAWLTDHIKPFVSHKILNNGYNGTAPWAQIITEEAAKVNPELLGRVVSAYRDVGSQYDYLRKPTFFSKERIWFDSLELKEYLLMHTSCDRRTIELDLSSFIVDSKALQLKICNVIQDKKTANLSDSELQERIKQIVLPLCDPTRKDELEEYLTPHSIAYMNKRQDDCPWISVPYPCDIPIESWIAIHDIRGYGEADEIYHRQFFSKGYTRIHLTVPSKKDKDKLSSLVYYLPPQEQLINRDFWNTIRNETVAVSRNIDVATAYSNVFNCMVPTIKYSVYVKFHPLAT